MEKARVNENQNENYPLATLIRPLISNDLDQLLV